jgi:PAS domain S-box-containing protein
LRAKTAELRSPRTDEATQRLVHELEVHQIELEMQNEELRRAREELTLSRKKYTDLYDFAPSGYFTFDANGVIREVNLTGAQLLGMERRLLANKPFISFIADADGKEIFSSHLETVLQRQGKQRCEIRLAGKEGTVIHGQLQSVTVDCIESKDVCILASIVDGTVGKQLETEIRDAREYAENIVETVREPLVVLNSDLKILTANHSFYDTFKVTPEETIGNFIYDLGNGQWDIPKLRVLLEDILPHDTVFNGYEVEHDFLDIGRKIILLNARQIFRENIGSHIILLAMEDITERKQLEGKLQKAHGKLEAANIELEAFNYSVTHDLRRPLANINGYCQVVKQLCGDKLDEQSKEYIQKIYEGTLRMDRLIDTLLRFSRVTRVEIRRETTDLSAMAKAVAAELELAEPERRVTFRIDEGIKGNGDAGLWRIVLDNLIGNAWKYTGNREEAVIEFGMTAVDGRLACFVRDNGPGFDMVFADKLFMPFQRISGTAVEGHGIGLATVERIVRRHGGKVWAESEPGKGATFFFTLE